MINILKQIRIILRTHRKELHSLISLKTVASSMPTVLCLDNGDVLTNFSAIDNTLNNHLVFIAKTIRKV